MSEEELDFVRLDCSGETPTKSPEPCSGLSTGTPCLLTNSTGNLNRWSKPELSAWLGSVDSERIEKTAEPACGAGCLLARFFSGGFLSCSLSCSAGGLLCSLADETIRKLVLAGSPPTVFDCHQTKTQPIKYTTGTIPPVKANNRLSFFF